MPTIRFVKKVLKRTLKEKQDNLIRLKFDLFYADKMYRELFNERKERYDKKKEKLEEIREEIKKEKSVPRKTRDKTKIIRLEKEANDLKNDIESYENELNRLTKQKEEIEEYIRQAIKLINSLKMFLRNEKLLRILGDEKYEKEN